MCLFWIFSYPSVAGSNPAGETKTEHKISTSSRCVLGNANDNKNGGVAHMAERSICIRKAAGSIPVSSISTNSTVVVYLPSKQTAGVRFPVSALLLWPSWSRPLTCNQEIMGSNPIGSKFEIQVVQPSRGVSCLKLIELIVSVVKWISHKPSKLKFRVRSPAETNRKAPSGNS